MLWLGGALSDSLSAHSSGQAELRRKKLEHARARNDGDPSQQRVIVTNTESGLTLAGEQAPLAHELQVSYWCWLTN